MTHWLKKNRRTLLFFLILFGFYTLLTAVIFQHRLQNIFTHYAMPDVDTDGGMWYQWFSYYTQKNDLLPYITDLIVYPYGYDLTFLPFSNLIYSIHVFLFTHVIGFSWQKLVFVTNMSSLVTYPLSAIGAAMLSYHLTRNKVASLFAGLIFGFSYYHVYMGRGQMSINHTEIIPFYFLSLFYFIHRKSAFSLFLSALVFSILFKADAYFAFFSGILSVPIVLFYEKDSIFKKIKIYGPYYCVLFILLILGNFNFFASNFYLFNQEQAAQTGRNSIAKNELTTVLYFLAPSGANYFFKNFGVIGQAIHLILPFLAGVGLLLFRRNRLYVSLMATFLLSVVLSSYIPSLYWLNILYFQYFGMFRGVSRIILPGYLFFGLLIGMVIMRIVGSELYRKTGKVVIGVWVLIFFLIVMSTVIPIDDTWNRRTDYSKIAALYDPIRTNEQIKVLATYPMIQTNGEIYGCPETYQIVAQIIHNKSFACGGSPFSKKALEYYREISDISKNTTIPLLTTHNVDTIIISNKLIENALTVNQTLRKDERLTFIGKYTQPKDEGYMSSNDASRDISVYQINAVVEQNKKRNTALFSIDNKTIPYKKISPYKYIVKIPRDSGKILHMNLPFSEKWELYDANLEDTHDLLLLVQKQKPLPGHHAASYSRNAWRLSETTGGKEYTLFFKPWSMIYLGNAIAGLSLASSVFLILVFFLHSRKKMGKKGKK